MICALTVGNAQDDGSLGLDAAEALRVADAAMHYACG